MIITEFYRTREDGVDLNRTYSDIHHYIIQNETQAKYTEAIDVVPMRYTYSESEEVIPDEPEPEEVELNQELGESQSENI